MVLRMTRPAKRPDSTFLTFRKRVPADIREKAKGLRVTFQFPEAGEANPAATVTVTMGAEQVKVSLRTREPAVAKARTGIAETHLQQVWEAVRVGPKSLTHKQIVALSGELYKTFAASLEDDPGAAAMWEKVIAANEAAARGVTTNPLRIPLPDEDPRVVSLEARFGAFVDVVLRKKGLVIDDASRAILLRESGVALTDAAKKLKRNAEGDYRPDTEASRFPAWEPAGSSNRPSGGTLTGLVDDWWKEQQREDGAKPSTHESYSGTMRKFVAFLGHDDASRVTTENVIAFKDHRLKQVDQRTGKPISARTIKNNDLAGLRSIFGWAVDNRRMATNPAIGVTIRVRQKPLLRDKEFTDDEARKLLTAALRYQPGPREFAKTAAAKRWAPWLCAYSGARIGEMVQLRKEDLRKEGDLWVLKVTPEAGSEKTNRARDVVLHPHLVELGFPEFVSGSAPGHLFLTPTPKGGVRGPWSAVKNRVQEFVRTIVPDPNVQPNHGWRHLFKTIGPEVGMEERVLDAIQGHAPKNVSRKYGRVTLKMKADAMEKFPRFEIEAS
jgi:integrase